MNVTFLNGQYRSGTTFLFKSLISSFDYCVYEPDSPNINLDSKSSSTSLHGFNPWNVNTDNNILNKTYENSPFIRGDVSSSCVNKYFSEIIHKLEKERYQNILIQTNQCSDYLVILKNYGSVFHLLRNIDDQFDSWQRTYLLKARYGLIFLKKILKPIFIKRHLWIRNQWQRYYSFLGIKQTHNLDFKTMYLEYYILGNYIASVSEASLLLNEKNLLKLSKYKIKFNFKDLDIFNSVLYNKNRSKLDLSRYVVEMLSSYERNS